MQNLNKNLFNFTFSHIYIEEKALNYPNTKKILKHFPRSEQIEVHHYKDVFSRSRQNYSLQQKSPKLILAVKEDHLLYDGAVVCESFGNSHFYYTSIMMNCLYDCEYCYLQGMYATANVVIFVNIEDYFHTVEKLLKKHSVYLSISYDTDLLAFEQIAGYGRQWIEFAKKHDDLKIEIRTKSANFDAIKDIMAQENIILAWTLSPDEMIKCFENKTPSLSSRLASIKSAIEKGWKVRLCFDPLLYTKNWKRAYKDLVAITFSVIEGKDILDLSIGTFRVSKDYLKRMKKQRRNSVILNYPFDIVEGVCYYNPNLSQEMVKYVYELAKKHVIKEKIYI